MRTSWARKLCEVWFSVFEFRFCEEGVPPILGSLTWVGETCFFLSYFPRTLLGFALLTQLLAANVAKLLTAVPGTREGCFQQRSERRSSLYVSHCL